MNAPILTTNIAGMYRLSWPDAHIGMELERFSENSKYEVSAELKVTTSLPGALPHLHQARFNLTSTSSRRTLANHLRDLLGEVPWPGLLEQACVIVLKKYREGEPAKKLKNVKVSERLRHRHYPLLLDKQANGLFGPPASGKSILSQYIAVQVDTANDENGMHAEPGNVLQLDYEDTEEEIAERVNALHIGMGLPPGSEIIRRFCYRPLVNEIVEIQRIVAVNSIDLIIVDSAGLACGGRPEEAEVTLQYFGALRSLRTTSLTIAHQPKHAEDNDASPFGSTYWKAMFRSMFHIRCTQEPGSDVLHLGIFDKKANSRSPLPPMGFKVYFENEGDLLKSVRFERQEVKDIPELEKGLSLRARLRNTLTDSGSMSVADLAELLEVPEPQVRARLHEFRDKDFVNLSPGTRAGKWGVVYPNEH